MAVRKTGRSMNWRYVDENRVGDHICYYSDLRKMKSHYPSWDITRTLENIFDEIVTSWTERLAEKAA
jgi:CDP-paratose 2-epimerase